MSLKTLSSFFYGHKIDSSNPWIDFSENGVTELSGETKIGSYTLTDFLDAVSVAMNEAGSQEYFINVDRVTRKTTISAALPFQLKVTTGGHAVISVFPLLGFTTDRTGSNSYESDVGSGLVYYPQFNLQSYVAFRDFIEAADASVNTSASGVVEVVSFGENRFMECNIRYATDIIGQGVIENNPTGVSDLRAFLYYATKKNPIEFMEDRDDPIFFSACILDKTPSSANGTGFMLNELYSRGLANYFESGKLTFREVR